MNVPLLILNVVFYGIILYLYGQAKQDPSISLGVGFAYMALFVLFPILQLILWQTKILKLNSKADRILMVTATPLLPLIIFAILSVTNRGEARSSTWEYNVNNHRYQEAHYNYIGTVSKRKIAFYKSVDTVNDTSPFPQTNRWVKDSVWLYFSQAGDTISKEHYRNDILIGK